MKNIYNKKMYKEEILLFLASNPYEPDKVAKYTSKIFFSHMAEIDLELYEKMLDIMTMEDGPEFEMTEEEFKKVLDKI